MDFHLKPSVPELQRSGCAVVAVFENRRLSDAASALDVASGGVIGKLVRRGDISGRVGHSLVLHAVPGVTAERVLLVGCGAEKKVDDERFRKAIAHAVQALTDTGARDAVSFLGDIRVEGRDTYWKCRQLIEICREKLYRFERLKSKPAPRPGKLRRLTINLADKGETKRARQALEHAVAIADGTELAKDLGNLPGNECTPTYLGEKANELAGTYPKLKARVLGEADMRKLEMGSLLSVAQGSREPAKLITLVYSGGAKQEKPIVLVGKGVTFDSGGISIKPSAAMDEMKFDMCGAASVLGVIRAVAALDLPVNVVGVIPATENLPGGKATKPGDIVTSMSGQTVEILNTDAEGRLILCDALTYSARYDPEVVIDIATLTGACVIALGAHASGLFANHQALADDLLEAGAYAGDRAWQLPLWEDYQDQLKSNFADMANVGGREAGAVTAACFLSRYTKDYRWAHLDIAGAAWHGGAKKGSTGRPVRLLTQYLLDRLPPEPSSEPS